MSTPSGQLVRFRDSGADYYDVYVEVNGAMYDRVEGLCGSFDGDQSNDFVYFDTETSAYVEDECTAAVPNFCCNCMAERFSQSFK